MKRSVLLNKLWQRMLYQALCAIMLALFVVTLVSNAFIHADGSGAPAWANPTATAIKHVGATDPIQHQPTFLSNLDCTFMTYRMVSGSTMQTGCFTPTAFGMLDSDSETVIFNGTDEGLPVVPYSPNQVLVPWPKALNLITLDATNTGGSYIGMYKNPLASMQNQRNSNGQLTAKKLTVPPEILLKDQTGQRLVINPQTMAFSDGGSWLVAETLGGSFVRINLATLDMTAFAQAFGSQGSPGALLKSQVASNDDGRYVAIENTVATSFKVYDLSTCGSNVSSWQTSNCQSHEYWPFVDQQIPGLKSLRHVRFINDGLLSFEATTTTGNDGVYELAPTGSITSLTDYIGLGDSYTSGEGAFDYLPGTDTSDNKCHVSINSYPLLLTRDLFSAAGGHSVACSGALINDVGAGSDSYRGQVSNGSSLHELGQNQSATLDTIYANYSPGYIAQHLFVKKYQPQVITASIGGNDIGFGDILQNCVMPHISRHTSDSTCYNTYEDRMELVDLVNRTVPRWVSLYKQLHAESPNTKIYVIGYPSIASDTGKCPLNVNLGKSELEFAEELIHYLDGATQQAATTAGINYIDVSQALNGHRLCEASGNDVAVNGLTAGKDFGALGLNVLGRESYHPNALGHTLIEQAILQQSHNLSSGLLVGANETDTSQVLNVPKSGRSINTLVTDDKLANPLLNPGTSSPLHVDGIRDGLQPNTPYTVRMDGPSGIPLSTIQSDSMGNLSGQITIPGDSVIGEHALDITGTNQSGETVDITQPIYIAGGGSDSDGDGIDDSKDSCVLATNSGEDTDQDGIDDICDGFLAPIQASNIPPASSSPPPSNDPPSQQSSILQPVLRESPSPNNLPTDELSVASLVQASTSSNNASSLQNNAGAISTLNNDSPPTITQRKHSRTKGYPKRGRVLGEHSSKIENIKYSQDAVRSLLGLLVLAPLLAIAKRKLFPKMRRFVLQ